MTVIMHLFREKDQPVAITPERAGEAYAWDRFRESLKASPDMAGIARILNGVDRRSKGLPPCELIALPLKEALRLFAVAKATVRSLDSEVVDHAVDEVAIVLCEGADGEYASFEGQSPTIQQRYRRWAVTAMNAAKFALEGRQI